MISVISDPPSYLDTFTIVKTACCEVLSPVALGKVGKALHCFRWCAGADAIDSLAEIGLVIVLI